MTLTLKPTVEPEPDFLQEEPRDFYMVWTKSGWAPRKAHDSFDVACAEAARLARLNHGKKFIVLKAVAKFHVPSRLTPPDVSSA